MSQELNYLSQEVALGRGSRRDFLGRAAALGMSAAAANALLASAAQAAGPRKGGPRASGQPGSGQHGAGFQRIFGLAFGNGHFRAGIGDRAIVKFDHHRALQGGGHRRSPIRNSAARSRRIWGGPIPADWLDRAGAKAISA